MKKIVFRDYDGTLNTGEEDMIKNIQAIQEFMNNGNLFVIATGRSYLDLKRKLESYPIPFDYLIVNHGGVILDKNEKVIDACLIPQKVGIQILAELKSSEAVEHIILFDTMKNDIVEDTNELTKIMVEMKDEKSARFLSEMINEKWKKAVKSYVIVTKKYCLVEIISVKTNKGKAIEKILEIEHIPSNAVYPIGDGANDVEMILKYHGYGMKNSEEIIYKATNKLCNAVYELIEKLNKE